MKILMINVVCGIRSTGRICTDLADALTEQGHEVKIAYGRETVPEKYQEYAVRIGNDLDVNLHVVKARLFDGCGFGSKAATVDFIEWVKEFDPDVIHLHNIHGYYINIEVLFNYLRYCGKKIIWTLHDCWAFTGHSAYCDAVNCERWITGCYDCPNMKEYPASLVDRCRENWAKKKKFMDQIPNMTIVTPSEWLACLVRKSFLAQYPVMVIHNGIDTKMFHKVKSSFKQKNGISEKVVLGVATSWDEMKGFSDFIQLSKKLGEEFRVVLVGVSEKQKSMLPQSMLGIIRTNSISELVEIYSDAFVLTLLSKVENYPTINIEALCCGTPVVSYDVGGSKEIIKENGIVVKKGDIERIAEAIRELDIKVEFDKTENDSEYTTKTYVESVYLV